jgi:hypothetical protein
MVAVSSNSKTKVITYTLTIPAASAGTYTVVV